MWETIENHILYLNYGIRVLIFLIVLFIAIRYRHRVAIATASSYILTLVLVMISAPRLFSLLSATLAASLTAWLIIYYVKRGKA